jgi:hypothetical protein
MAVVQFYFIGLLCQRSHVWDQLLSMWILPSTFFIPSCMPVMKYYKSEVCQASVFIWSPH